MANAGCNDAATAELNSRRIRTPAVPPDRVARLDLSQPTRSDIHRVVQKRWGRRDQRPRSADGSGVLSGLVGVTAVVPGVGHRRSRCVVVV